MGRPLIDRYEIGAEVLASACSGLGGEQAGARPGPGAWSIAELVAHLVDCDSVFNMRLKYVLAEDRPTLQAFDEVAWIERLGSAEMPIDEGIALFAAGRRWMTRLLREATEADLARVGVHTERGPQTVEEIVTYAANHVDHHLKFLYGKRENLGIPLPRRFTTD